MNGKALRNIHVKNVHMNTFDDLTYTHSHGSRAREPLVTVGKKPNEIHKKKEKQKFKKNKPTTH